MNGINSKHIEEAQKLRDTVEPHYNCAQSVVMPFAEECGVEKETARRIAANFGGGMKCGSVCGAVTGGLMALGLHGADDAECVKTYYETLNKNHSCLNCAELLKTNEANGGSKKSFCDGMVKECVELVEQLVNGACK